MKRTALILGNLALILAANGAHAQAGTAPPPPSPPPQGWAPPPAAAPLPPPAAAPLPPPASPPVAAPQPAAPPPPVPAPQPAAPAAPSAVPQAPVAQPNAQPAPQLEPSDPNLPWHIPQTSERFVTPPPPPPPEPPPAKFTVSAYTQWHNFVAGDLDGSTAELGARLGFGGGNASVGLGIIPKDGLPVISLDALRLGGVRVTGDSAFSLAILAPSLQAKLVTDFSDNIIAVAGISATGLRACGCKGLPIPWFVDVRIPYVNAWLPFKSSGAGIDEAGITPALSWGFSVEAGIISF